MNTSLVVASVVVVAGGRRLFSWLEQEPDLEDDYENESDGVEAGEISEELAAALQPLFDPSFSERAQSQDVISLVTDLKNRQVITEDGQLDIATIEALALTDSILPHNDKYYTQTELDVHTLAFHVWA